jgi:hypothetical protein
VQINARFRPITARLPAACYLVALTAFGVFALTHARFVWELGLAASLLGVAIGALAVVRGALDLVAWPEWDPDRRIVRTRVAFGLTSRVVAGAGITMQSGAYLEMLPVAARALVPAELVSKPDLLLTMLTTAGATLLMLTGALVGWRHARESFRSRAPDPLDEPARLLGADA